MKYTREDLRKINILTLRNLARNIGVYAPTRLSKPKLVDEMMLIINGEKPPRFPNGRGKPPKQPFEKILLSINQETAEIEEERNQTERIKEETIACILREMETVLRKIL